MSRNNKIYIIFKEDSKTDKIQRQKFIDDIQLICHGADWEIVESYTEDLARSVIMETQMTAMFDKINKKQEIITIDSKTIK